ncbi:hypothetical protein KIPB_001179 [Kipferlia bialata]|uniref:Uncharacterized protein n=1 Tax=Kipferlia bialata TaxID=797122 RepID=A0A9K3CNH4_9EUKA|nr:hypothetical protein KIPB_001179 [Kipferlia bialata]|eukprot:g1179.t1
MPPVPESVPDTPTQGSGTEETGSMSRTITSINDVCGPIKSLQQEVQTLAEGVDQAFSRVYTLDSMYKAKWGDRWNSTPVLMVLGQKRVEFDAAQKRIGEATSTLSSLIEAMQAAETADLMMGGTIVEAEQARARDTADEHRKEKLRYTVKYLDAMGKYLHGTSVFLTQTVEGDIATAERMLLTGSCQTVTLATGTQ